MSDDQMIRWHSWSEQAFATARAESKRVFLSISASWCHWCHVMDEESLSHPEVIRLINTNFIPIRVDSDQRPDINSRYNMGGWPTVAILDAQGEVLAGETYLPTGQLLAMLTQPFSDVVERPDHQRVTPSSAPGRSSVDASLLSVVADAVERAYDRTFGGFGLAPKFPQPWATEFALHRYGRTGDVAWRQMATFTLDQMRGGEIYDLADGGFFRYAASHDWDHPHDEKMLDVNAQLVVLYLRAYRVTGEAEYRATAKGIIEYLLTELAVNGQPWFCGSQSADRDYYSLPSQERLVTESPSVDRTLYTDRNAMAVSALLLAGELLGQQDYRQAGLELLDYLWDHCRRPDEGVYHGERHSSSIYGYLSDQVWMVTALLDGVELAAGHRWMERAEELASVMDHQLWDSCHGGYWDRPEGEESVGLLRVRLKPFAENAIAAITMIRLYHLTGKSGYRRQAERLLEYLAPFVPRYKHHAAAVGVALERFLHPPDMVVVTGRHDDPLYRELLRAANRLPSIWLVVVPLETQRDRQRIEELGYQRSDQALAYVCKGTRCQPPVGRPEDLDLSAMTR